MRVSLIQTIGVLTFIPDEVSHKNISRVSGPDFVLNILLQKIGGGGGGHTQWLQSTYRLSFCFFLYTDPQLTAMNGQNVVQPIILSNSTLEGPLCDVILDSERSPTDIVILLIFAEIRLLLLYVTDSRTQA